MAVKLELSTKGIVLIVVAVAIVEGLIPDQVSPYRAGGRLQHAGSGALEAGKAPARRHYRRLSARMGGFRIRWGSADGPERTRLAECALDDGVRSARAGHRG